MIAGGDDAAESRLEHLGTARRLERGRGIEQRQPRQGWLLSQRSQMLVDHAQFVQDLVTPRVPTGSPLQMLAIRTAIDCAVVTDFAIKGD